MRQFRIAALQRQPAMGRPDQPDNAQQRGFAGAVAAADDQSFAGRDRKLTPAKTWRPPRWQCSSVPVSRITAVRWIAGAMRNIISAYPSMFRTGTAAEKTL